MENKEKRPKVGVGVLVFNDKNEILIGKRKGAHGEGTYGLPGGHLEFGESFEQCAKREVMEETGVKIKNVTFVGLTNDIFLSENKHYITLFLSSILDGGKLELKEPNKCEGWSWIKWENLPENLFIPLKNFKDQNKTIKRPD